MSIIKTHEVTLRGGDEINVVLRPLRDDHLPLLYKWCADAEVVYWSDCADAQPHDEESVHHIYGTVSQTALCFLIEADDIPIGECWLQQMNVKRILDIYPNSSDIRRIDMMIGEKSYWNKGIGTTLVGMLTEYAFSSENADVLYGFVSGYNERSKRVFEKNGFYIHIRVPSESPATTKEDYYLRLTRREYVEKCKESVL